MDAIQAYTVLFTFRLLHSFAHLNPALGFRQLSPYRSWVVQLLHEVLEKWGVEGLERLYAWAILVARQQHSLIDPPKFPAHGRPRRRGEEVGEVIPEAFSYARGSWRKHANDAGGWPASFADMVAGALSAATSGVLYPTASERFEQDMLDLIAALAVHEDPPIATIAAGGISGLKTALMAVLRGLIDHAIPPDCVIGQEQEQEKPEPEPC